MITGPRSKRKFELIPVRDPEIYPLLICVSTGVALLAVYNVHNLMYNPDVNLRKERRETPAIDRYDPEESRKFVQHREKMASLRPNPGNAEEGLHEQRHAFSPVGGSSMNK
uniref:Uncharacterized protein n=1 Tax=Globisporangium ultimum (strain ATCC 200006 / CBS 805.95 / DAOM BR144) TaxID=431595 RepID=K3W674_GLOUD